MRLVTTRKLYRAFPELDEFEDEQCRRLVNRVRKKLTYAPVAVPSVLAAVVLGLVGGGVLGAYLDDPLERLLHALTWRHSAEQGAIAFMLVATFGSAALAGLVTRDFVIRLYLRRALRERIRRIRCLGCQYILLGQHVVAGAVTCPECGVRWTLDQLGLDSPADLIPPDATVEDAELNRTLMRTGHRVRCLGCECPLLGRQPVDGTVTCPRCGMRNTLRQLGLTPPQDLVPPDVGAIERDR